MPFQGADVSMAFLGDASTSDRCVEIHQLTCLSMWLPGTTSLEKLGLALPLEWDATPVRCVLTCVRGNCYVLLLEKSIYNCFTHVIEHPVNKLAVSLSCQDPDFPSIHQAALFLVTEIIPQL